MMESLPNNNHEWHPDYTGRTAKKGRLTFEYYYAQVVGTSVDPNRAGCVQARISGVTDKWADKDQPWFAPQLTTGMQQVPQQGQWLLVKFIDGDINQGMYYGVSQTKGFLPEKYVSEYPDVAVLNMGESGYTYTHNRRTHTSTVKNPGNGSEATWNAAGEMTLTADSASSEESANQVSVLTEQTIDIFTCRPVGNPASGIRAGSEYLRVPHISTATIDALRGNGSAAVVTAKPVKDEETDGLPTKEIYGKDSTYEIPFMESPAAKRRAGKRNRRIIVGATGASPLAEFLSNYTDDNAKNCAHYLVGLGDGEPDVLSSLGSPSQAKNLGFIQCAEVSYDCTLGADMRGKPNLDAIGVMFYGNGELNDYQVGKLLDIVNHIKRTSDVDEVTVVAYRPPTPIDTRFVTYLKLKTYEGGY